MGCSEVGEVDVALIFQAPVILLTARLQLVVDELSEEYILTGSGMVAFHWLPCLQVPGVEDSGRLDLALFAQEIGLL